MSAVQPDRKQQKQTARKSTGRGSYKAVEQVTSPTPNLPHPNNNTEIPNNRLQYFPFKHRSQHARVSATYLQCKGTGERVVSTYINESSIPGAGFGLIADSSCDGGRIIGEYLGRVCIGENRTGSHVVSTPDGQYQIDARLCGNEFSYINCAGKNANVAFVSWIAEEDGDALCAHCCVHMMPSEGDEWPLLCARCRVDPGHAECTKHATPVVDCLFCHLAAQPRVGGSISLTEPQFRVFVYTKREIHAGEELFLDYGPHYWG